jgi:uncharacterized protein (DUF2384 family)
MATMEREKKAVAATIAWAHDDLSLAYGEIGLAVEADERTVRRWHGMETAPRGSHREKLESFRELRHLLETVFESQLEAEDWLHSSVPALRGRTPISAVRRGHVDAVVGILATMESGAYS